MVAFLTTCKQREFQNPWDELAALQPEEWAPTDFTIEDVSITEKKLSWAFDENMNIKGFILDLKIGNWSCEHIRFI